MRRGEGDVGMVDGFLYLHQCLGRFRQPALSLPPPAEWELHSGGFLAEDVHHMIGLTRGGYPW